MTSTKNYTIGLVLAVAFLVSTNVRAEMMTSAVDVNELTFVLTGWKDNNAVKSIEQNIGMHPSDAFQFTITNEGNKAKLTFDYTQAVKDNNLQSMVGGGGANGGDANLKFKSFGLYKDSNTPGFDGIVSTSGNWSNGGWSATSIDLVYGAGYSWNDLVAFVTADNFTGYIAAHIQSIGSNGASINGGVFTYVPEKSTGDNSTPEPATLAIIGLGLAGLGLARRRMTK